MPVPPATSEPSVEGPEGPGIVQCVRFFRVSRPEPAAVAAAIDEPDEDPASGSTAEDYRAYTERILASRDPEERETAMALAIGASSIEEFKRSGQLELDLLVQSGLQPDHYLVDVGCGSGRLAIRLAESGHPGHYLGTELSPDLLDFARAVADRPDWRFEAVEGLTIPAGDDTADMVCFFSVLTHLRHEQSFLYLEDARRVLKPGGRIVFSFLDFSQRNHRAVFEATVDALRAGNDLHLNQFMSLDAIEVCADYLGMEIEAVHGGATPYIHVSDSEHYEPGLTMQSLGQSACVMVKPS